MKYYRTAIEELEKIAQMPEEEVLHNWQARSERLYNLLSSAHSKFGGDLKERDEKLSNLCERVWALQASSMGKQRLWSIPQRIIDLQMSLSDLRFDGLNQMNKNISVFFSLLPEHNFDALSKMSIREAASEQGINAASAIPVLGFFIAALNLFRLEFKRRRASDTFQHHVHKVADLLRYLETLDIIEFEYIPQLEQKAGERCESLVEIDARIREVSEEVTQIETTE